MRRKSRRTFGDIEREWERKNDLPDWAKDDELTQQCRQDAERENAQDRAADAEFEAWLNERCDR